MALIDLARFKYRRITAIHLQRLPQRGPCLLIGNKLAKAAQGDIKRRIAFQTTIRQPTWFASKAAQRLLENLAAGSVVWLTVDSAPCFTDLADYILKKIDPQLGVEVLLIESKVSAPQFIRRDLQWRLSPLQLTELYPHYAHDAVATALGLGQIIQDRLMLYTGLQLQAAHEDSQLHDQLLIEKLARLIQLQLMNDEAIPSSTLHQVRQRWQSWQENHRGEPLLIANYTRRVERLSYFFDQLDVRDRSLYIHAHLGLVQRRLLRRSLLWAMLIPLGGWGVMQHYIAYKLPDWWHFWCGRDVIRPWLWRGLALPITYILQALCIDALTSPGWALLYLCSLPIFAGFALLLIENRTTIWDDLGLWWFINRSQSPKGDLVKMRWELVETIAYAEPTQTVQH